MESVIQDLRYSLRMILKQPRFFSILILTVALGIGANSMIFSVVNTLLLGPLPFRDSDRLVALWRTVPAEEVDKSETSPPDFQVWREQGTAFEGMAGYFVAGANFAGAAGEPDRVHVASASANLFNVLGVEPAHGRLFRPEEEQFGNHRVAVISHGLWRRQFGASEQALGRTVELDSEPYQIVGVMPEGFWFPQGPPRVDLWIPLSFEPNSYLNTRKNYFLSVVARLKPGATVEQARANMESVSRQLAENFRENAGSGASVVPFREEVVGDVRGALWVVFAAVSFVLLIACVNVANLLLARAASRDKEIAIRGALGANRARLVRQLLVESVLVALIGGALGLLLTYVGVSSMNSLIPGDIARGMEIRVDAWVLAFTFLVSLVTGVAFGLVPALQASKPNLTETLKEGGRSGSGTISGKVRGLLVVT
ncbi:MAG TPA: ABC transporter permease, partial [Pyrinomonadaceae bacterium]|nr:ABC transporter permease [Pyrinomonadaceae bacterium]